MPEESKSSTTFLYVLLAIVVLVTIGLVTFYFLSKPKQTAQTGVPSFANPQQTNQDNSQNNADLQNPNVKTSVYEGYVQEISQKNTTIEGVTYHYVIGLVDKDSNTIPVWLTDFEYNNLEIFDNRNNNMLQATLNNITGGMLLKVTRTVPINAPDQSGVTVVIEQ